MGAKPNLTICAYCGGIFPRTEDMDTSFIKCLKCQAEGRTKLLDIETFSERKNEWLRRLSAQR